MGQSALPQLAAAIRHNGRLRTTPLVIAVDGRSGTGKSTLAEALATSLEAVVLPGDDFFAGGVALRADTPEALARDCIDWQCQRAVLTELIRTGKTLYRPFDWEAFDGSKRQEPVSVEACKFILLEGVYSARPELRDLIDMRILVDLPHDLRMERLIQREGEIGPWEIQWHVAEDWYFAHHVHRSDFDVIVSSVEVEYTLTYPNGHTGQSLLG